MLTLVPRAYHAHPGRTTDWPLTAAGQIDPTPDSSHIGLILLVVAVVSLVLALRQLRRALIPIADLMRMVLSASLVAVLIVAAVVLVIGSTLVRR